MPAWLSDFAFRILTVVGSALVLMFFSEFYFLNEAPSDIIAAGLAGVPVILLLVPGYILFAYLFHIVLDHFRIGKLSGLFLAGAIFGWATEALFVPITYEEPPVSLFFPSVGWHALVDVLAGWYFLRLAMRRLPFWALSGLFALTGTGWGLWATWSWEGTNDAAFVYSMGQFRNIVLIASTGWIIGTLMSDFAMARGFDASRGEGLLVGLVTLALFVSMGLAFWPWMLALAALVALTLVALWRGRGGTCLAPLAHAPPGTAYLAMPILPVGALLSYWLVQQNGWALPAQSIVLALLFSGGGFFFWSIWRMFTHR